MKEGAETRGVSVFDRPDDVTAKGMVPHEVDQASVPESLQIQRQGDNPHHHEIVPKPGADLTQEGFKKACENITCK